MNCVIIEDEKVAAERLTDLLQRYDPNINILGILQSVELAVEWLNHNQPVDLLFMDIQLSDGLSFEIFENTFVKTPVIFTTAYDEYALKAFKVNSIDYLLKPIDFNELGNAIDKFKSGKEAAIYPSYVFDNVLKRLTNEYKTKFVVKVGEPIRVILADDIQCAYVMDKATFLKTNKGIDYALNYTLDQLEELLDPEKFFRINRKYIAAFDSIVDIISYSNSRLLIKLNSCKDDDLIVSRDRVQQFKKWLET